MDRNNQSDGKNQFFNSSSNITLKSFDTSTVDIYDEPSGEESKSDHGCDFDIDFENEDKSDNEDNDNNENESKNENPTESDRENESGRNNYRKNNILLTITTNRVELLNRSQLSALQKCMGSSISISSASASASASASISISSASASASVSATTMFSLNNTIKSGETSIKMNDLTDSNYGTKTL